MAKALLLALVVSLIVGPLIILGSIAGAAFPKPGLFAGAFVGGWFGVALAAHIATLRGIIAPELRGRTIAGGIAGFVLAAAIAVQNLHTPVIPALCGILVPLGAVVGSRTGRRSP